MSELPAVTSGEIALQIKSVEKSYGTFKALRKLDLSVRKGEFLTLLGPSGSGKTTLLKSIAGFETIDEGAILLNGQNVSNTPPAKRDIGMVFQNYALFPHLTVAENVAFPLRMRRMARDRIAHLVQETLARVALPDHGARYPKQLSGGQQQRVALARAVVFGPKLLLLDEPFGALDRKLREGMQEEVRALQRRLGLTTVFITHDQEEALVLSDRIAVMDSGHLLQVGTPEDIYANPADVFTAAFVGESNLFGAEVVQTGEGAAPVRLRLDAGSEVTAPLSGATAEPLAPGQRVTLLVRPENLFPLGQGLADGTVRARLREVQYLGNTLRARFETLPAAGQPGQILTLRQPAAAPRLAAEGSILDLGWSAADSRVLAR